jgi:hypothetical protein
MSSNRNHNLDSMFAIIGNPEVYTDMAFIRVYDPESEESASYALGVGASDDVPTSGDLDDLGERLSQATGFGAIQDILEQTPIRYDISIENVAISALS